MKIGRFLREKAIFLAINAMIYIVVAGIMMGVYRSFVEIFILGCIWFLPLLSYILIEYLRYRRYFNNLENILESLEKKYLLPEVIEQSDGIVEQNINKVFKVVGRDMHEHVKYHRDMQDEYREYIETWVHEIKTPIASAKLLIENNESDITKKIDIQLERVENYVEQVLYYSRSNEVNKDFLIREVNLNEIIRNVIKRNYRDFISKGIKVHLEDIDKVVYCDPKWIEFILNQIIGNAVKYSKSKRASIKVKVDKVNDSVMLSIEDNGVGIVDRDINRVFEKGFTGENGRRFGKSTGMGLYLCKKLGSKLGIKLEIESELNKGTKVIVIFPDDEFFSRS